MSYLKSGLDSLSDWNGDMEGFHSSIQHFGFENLLRTDNLIPAFILREDAKMPVISLKLSCPRKSSYVPVCQLVKGIYLFK